MLRRIALFLAPLLVMATMTVASGTDFTVVHPATIDSLLINPGMGFTSSERPGNAPIDGEGYYPRTSIAYYRWYWNQIEQPDGSYDFGPIDQALQSASRAGQTLGFRIMCADGGFNPVPEGLQAEMPGVSFQGGFVPDFNSPYFLSHALRLVAALGERYNGNPVVDFVDIGTVGLWGEWHTSNVVGAPAVKTSTCQAVIDAYRRAFPNTTLIALINSVDGLKYVRGAPVGWRADCLGDLGIWSDTWSHMRNKYPANVDSAGIQDQWKIAPVIFEICLDFQAAYDDGYDINEILNYALGYHCSILNGKSIAIPSDWRVPIESFVKKMGYRLAVVQFRVPDSLRPGESALLSSQWVNSGVAPPYRPYRLVYRLRNQRGQAWTAVSNTNIGALLPGAWDVNDALIIPAQAEPGVYQLEVALFDPGLNRPVIRLANAGRRSDGWYPISVVKVIGTTGR